MTLTAAPVAVTADAATCVDATRAGQRSWAAVSLADRQALLRRLADLVLARAEEIADVVVAETGKPRVEAYTTELYPALDAARWLEKHAARVLAPERVRYSQPHLWQKRGWILHEPLGVVAVITPWNFPFAIPFTQVASVVAAGNGAVVKPSELTPRSSELVAELFAAAGAPPRLVSALHGGPEAGAALVRSGVEKILFTGSVETGRAVATVAGARLVPVTLELGGKDPMLVLDDADLARAVDGALWASFVNCGQVCSGVERIYVEAPLYEPFVEELVRRARGLRIGDELGPLISAEQRDRVAGLVDEAVAAGAHVLAGGRAPDRPGWFYEPTVLAQVPAHARIEHEETFGPVVTVCRVASEREAIQRANATPFGLGASVWSRDPVRARRVAGALQAGSVWHNDHAYSYGAAQASWGGRGQSGFGRTHSRHGLYELVNLKFVDRDAGRVPVPWWFPYDARAAEAFRGALAPLYAGRLGTRARSVWRERAALRELARRYRR
jgi:succinate-semialdehyde dehydrogenase/glutarate-semialdehyde dehydrogenase